MAELSDSRADQTGRELAIKPPRVPRDRNGRVLPGASANPGGKPAGWAEFRSRMRERTEEAEAFVLKCLRRGEPDEQRWAATSILQYAWGRPPQRVHLAGDDESPPVRTELSVDLARLTLEQQLALLALADGVADGG